jgi:hypothetical protein
MDDQQYEFKPLAEMSDKEFEDYLFTLLHDPGCTQIRMEVFSEAIYRIKDRAETISRLRINNTKVFHKKLTHPHVTLGVER